MAGLTRKQLEQQRQADEQGCAFVTMIHGRVAILLPPLPSDEDTSQYIVRLLAALQAAGLA